MKIALVIFITLALAGCALLSLHMGVIPVPWRALLTDWQAGREHYYVLMEYRLPRLLLALFVGAALAVAGVLIQGIVRNPLASPDILGVNHAASLASVGALLLMPSLPVMVLPLLAFAGGMAGLILLKMLAKTHQPMKLALTGVAACGPISFIGLVVPHMMRSITGGRHRRLLPVSALTGALLLVVADLLARIIHPPLELPVGVLTAIIGAPWFVWLLVRMR
ncbi:iron chelate uptake ABC transporter family permease subunit [Escherichia coli]|uniref:iron chelate uptake ABC transporter family permease subunit n=1 Tax=Escherichia coli TaxID=562 RepID=UPI000BE500FE|nr:iron chelate uptake ABC transporter family permease subunit [Escherichia coli]EEZ5987695.1 iron chelate uptake ABC transporter family permease subunit [Escherichia coli O78]EEY9271031.1 hypothetical protein [Escherichia coli]EFJ2160632.1 iron chelate uptake ABC transporter family permease subunit [Escherichia coli]EFJ2177978.1 iron chelate uptake ABC transporter family permease subunit [Escherichia coli]EFK5250761.1 iron chelate uptake ABC transporter family permease subunit [Escherichia co